MTSLLDLFSLYPVLEALVSHLGLADVVNLSRTNFSYRATLHGFPCNRFEKMEPSLFIGQHRTSLWENLKAKTILQCAESQHKPSTHAVRSCRTCSLPICEACIIRDSFTKRNESTFHSRYRNLCTVCWRTGNSHKRQLLRTLRSENLWPRKGASNSRGLCICSAKEGNLCLGCKTTQNEMFEQELAVCFGDGCSISKQSSFEGRICLWCDLPLPGGRSRAESRRAYDAKHLHAKTHWCVLFNFSRLYFCYVPIGR